MQRNWRLKAPEWRKQTGPGFLLSFSFLFVLNNILQSTSTTSQKENKKLDLPCTLEAGCWKKSRMQLKHGFLLSFTSLCNFIIVSSINSERILILASAGSPPLLLSQLSQSPVRAFQHPTNQALWGRGEREAELEVEGCQQGTSSTGPHHRATAYIPVELWWLTVPKFALSRKKTCKLPRTRLRQRSPEANAWLLLTLNQITHARGCLPGWTWPGQRCATFFQYHRTISFPLWKLRRSLILTQAIFSPITFPKLFRQHPWLPKTCRSEPKSSAMLLWVPFSNR